MRIASIAQGQALSSIGKAATSVLPPLTTLSLFSKMNMPLTQVALVARPCAPAAQRAEDSTSSRSRLVISLFRFAPLGIEQDCFFRVPLPKTKCLLQSAFGGQRDFRPPDTSPKTPFKQLSKAADALQPLEFEKQSSLRTDSARCRLCRGDVMIFNFAGGSACSGHEKLTKSFNLLQVKVTEHFPRTHIFI